MFTDAEVPLLPSMPSPKLELQASTSKPMGYSDARAAEGGYRQVIFALEQRVDERSSINAGQ